jgi:uncharacterized protein YndB with AHSA1/START domain
MRLLNGYTEGILMESVIAADQQRVWRAITEAAQLSIWFDGSMGWEFTPVAGEPITFRYNGEAIGYGTVVTISEVGFEALREDLRQRRHEMNAEGWVSR